MTQAVSTARMRTWGAACSVRSCSKKGSCHLRASNCCCFAKIEEINEETQPCHDAGGGIKEFQKMRLPKTQLAGAAQVASKLLPKGRVSNIDCATTRCAGATQKMDFCCIWGRKPLGCLPRQDLPVTRQPQLPQKQLDAAVKPLGQFTDPVWKAILSGAYRARGTHLQPLCLWADRHLLCDNNSCPVGQCHQCPPAGGGSSVLLLCITAHD